MAVYCVLKGYSYTSLFTQRHVIKYSIPYKNIHTEGVVTYYKSVTGWAPYYTGPWGQYSMGAIYMYNVKMNMNLVVLIVFLFLFLLQHELGNTEKPEEIFDVIEHFCLGRRRLHLFGTDATI